MGRSVNFHKNPVRGSYDPYEKLIVDAEILQMLSEVLQPLTVDEASLGLDAIAEVGPGGHFFGSAHTLERYETALYRPIVSDWRNYETWAEDGARTATERANGIWKQLLAEFEPPPIDPARAEAIDDFIARRKRELATGTSGGPAHRQGSRLAEDQAARRTGARAEVQVRPVLEAHLERGECLETGEVDADAGVRAHRERQVRAGVHPLDVERIRVREERRVAVGCRQRHDHEIAAGDPGPGELDLGRRIPIHARRRRLEPQRFLDGVGGERPIGPESVHRAGSRQHVPERARRHAL